MAIYEILIRGNADGTIAGAHQILFDVNGNPGRATALDPATVGSILGVGFATAVADVPQMQTELADLRDENAGLKAQLGAPSAGRIDWLSFMALFTPTEQAQIALSNNPSVAVFRMMAMGLGGDLDMTDPRVAQGLDALVAAGLLSGSRRDMVLAQQRP